jgi:hypothetical protein
MTKAKTKSARGSLHAGRQGSKHRTSTASRKPPLNLALSAGRNPLVPSAASPSYGLIMSLARKTICAALFVTRTR